MMRSYRFNEYQDSNILKKKRTDCVLYLIKGYYIALLIRTIYRIMPQISTEASQISHQLTGYKCTPRAYR